LLFDRSGNRLLEGLRIRTDVCGQHLNLGWSDVRELGAGKLNMVMAPTITIKMEITMATMGRLMKNLDTWVTFPSFPPSLLQMA